MIVGLTGGIGSGKTTVAQIFQQLKVPVFVADEESKRLLDTDADLQAQLVEWLGPELIKEGRVDRAYMASRIFKDEDLLKKVNALIHPAVGRAFQTWYQKQEAPYIIREAAILFESGTHKDCAKIIVVSAPEELRLQRVIKRSGESPEQVKARMAKQWPQEKKEALADYIIHNDHQEMLIPQVLQIHEDLIHIANTGR
ncbi:dephospho-CoA kinase [Croceimicrobium hydrocarbonivorans]|uniref:Dephospho-CoA kinase n=1 Tax=Croceimicrobium hydrocarbonivorans TaxID=2761580 RepID=A0A7H0VE51_9FLAO|nr:dephospho-CoA kinase [Croceimicrobium hydrocarbonivorans]QNR23999.1 dephospho-CoA kinase [Croceimicrobium hydrocarbonivorans]